ncbi:MAG: 50S ribosomal protein L25 [Gemmatimonadales bacterium]
MQHLNLPAESRTRTGKGVARTLRRQGKVPAVIYGRSLEARPLAVDHRIFGKLLETIGGEAALIDVSIDGAPPVMAVVREVQRDPVRRSDIVHFDLYAVVADEPIVVDVPVHIIGTAEGVRNQGGVLDHHLHRISLKVLPGDIPDHIEVDVTNLTLGHAIHVGDITVAKGEIVNDADISVVSVVVSRAEVAAATPEVVATEPEVIKKGKAEEGEEAAEGEAEGGKEAKTGAR